MYKLYPYFTNDGSVGLFSPQDDDIYHSTYGALTEAYEKFILPSGIKNFLKKNKKIKILDICFGIGYNTKSLLNFIYTETIGTNNIYIDKKYTDNDKFKISIHAIDIDKNLAYLSPFFITNKKIKKNNKLNFKQEKIQKMLADKTEENYKLNNQINYLLLQNIINCIDSDVEKLLFAPEYSQYFDKTLQAYYKLYKLSNDKTHPLRGFYKFLHNIYYRNISPCNKSAINPLRFMDLDFKLEINDARQAIKNDSQKYNYIFLDAFTPVKCPCLWSIDFFRLLYDHLETDGMILTYSNSALVRNAFLNAGFYVGKIYSQSIQKFTGTVAVKNKSLIKYELSEYDLGLMKTKAGIFYRDKNLTLDNEAIIEAHKIEVENSNLLSSSKFIKQYKLKR